MRLPNLFLISIISLYATDPCLAQPKEQLLDEKSTETKTTQPKSAKSTEKVTTDSKSAKSPEITNENVKTNKLSREDNSNACHWQLPEGTDVFKGVGERRQKISPQLPAAQEEKGK